LMTRTWRAHSHTRSISFKNLHELVQRSLLATVGHIFVGQFEFIPKSCRAVCRPARSWGDVSRSSVCVLFSVSVFDPLLHCYRSLPQSFTPSETSIKGMFLYISRGRTLYKVYWTPSHKGKKKVSLD
jgi:hypothetical protein